MEEKLLSASGHGRGWTLPRESALLGQVAPRFGCFRGDLADLSEKLSFVM